MAVSMSDSNEIKLYFQIKHDKLRQACRTQKTVRAAHWVLRAKNRYSGRSLKNCNPFSGLTPFYNTFFVNINHSLQILPYYNCFMPEIIKFNCSFQSYRDLKRHCGPHVARWPPVWHAWYTSVLYIYKM